MPYSINVSSSEGYRYTYFNDGTVREDRVVPGKILKIHWEIGKGCSEFGNEYWQATVEINSPNGRRQGAALLWDQLLFSDNDLGLDEGSITEGTEIILAIIINGEDAGNAVIEIPDFHIKFKDLYDQGFNGIEDFEDVSPQTSSEYEEFPNQTESTGSSLNSNVTYETLSANVEEDYRLQSLDILNATEITSNSEPKEEGCGKSILIFGISFLLVGLVLSPFSYLGFLLYPFLVGGGLLLGNFFYKFFNSKN